MESRDLKSLTVAQLKGVAAECGVDVKGMKKAEIVAALDEAQSAGEAVAVVAEVIDGPAKETTLDIHCSAGELSANFDALDAYVDGILADYEGWEPKADNEDDVRQCESQRKYLNALASDLDTRRKAVKAQYLKPLNAFEARANAIRDKVKATSNRLNDVVKDAKAAQQEAKRAALQAHYEEYAEFLAPVVPYERIHDPKWLNKEPKLPKAMLELEARVGEIASAWESLKSLGLEFYEQAEAHFFATLDLGKAVEYNNKLASDRRKIEEMKANMAAQEACAEPEPYVQEAPEPYEPGPIAYQPAPEPYVPAPEPYAPPAPIAPPTYAEAYANLMNDAQPAPAIDRVPCVMVIEAASVGQMQEIGRFCGSLSPSVTGVFKRGTLDEAYASEIARRGAVNGRVG